MLSVIILFIIALYASALAVVRAHLHAQRGAGPLREGLDDRHLLLWRHVAVRGPAAALPGGGCYCGALWLR